MAKRMLDVVVAGAGLILLAPLLLGIAVLVRLKLGSPVLFRHNRPGLHEQIFPLIKFRTMTNARGADGKLLPDAERLTPFGHFLRSSSLDELPALLNVLRGEMSLVGPRPLIIAYLPLYSPEERRRHSVRPGITGLAQVSGRNALTWPEKFKLDVWYVDNQTLLLDLRILLLTVWKVLRREGINNTNDTLMPGYGGYDDSLS